jgi:hypothetical protein
MNKSCRRLRLDVELNRWFPSGAGLPALPVTDLAVHGGFVYASVGDNSLDPSVPTGVYVSTDQGFSWAPAGSALQQRPISSLAVTDSGVFAGSSAGVWRLDGACAADFDADGAVTSQDFFDFLAAFFAGLPAADFNDSGAVDSQDFFDFLGAFFAGCE